MPPAQAGVAIQRWEPRSFPDWATCPEKVISLTPQIDFRAATARPRVIKEETPANCVRCGVAFGVKSTIDRVVAKLEG